MAKETIEVIRLSFEDGRVSDMVIDSVEDLPQQIEVMWGEGENWKNFKSGTRFIITFEDMPLEEFEALEEWDA